MTSLTSDQLAARSLPKLHLALTASLEHTFEGDWGKGLPVRFIQDSYTHFSLSSSSFWISANNLNDD